MKQRVPITNKSSKFKGGTQPYVVKLPKSAGARHYCPNILRVPGTLGTRANSSPDKYVYKDLVHLAIMYLTFSKCCICSKKQGIRSKSLLVASLSKSIFLTPGSSFPKGISIWRIMSVSHQSCPFFFPVILTKMDYFSKNVVSEQMGKSGNDCQGAPSGYFLT